MSSEAVIAAAYLILANGRRRSRKKPRWWIRDLFVKSGDNRKELFEKLPSNDGSLFKNFTRMNRQDFDYLIEKVTPLVKKADTNSVEMRYRFKKSNRSRPLYAPYGTLDFDTQVGSVISGSWRAVVQDDTGMVNLQRKPRKSNEEAKAVRDEFARYFMSQEGKISWQDNY
ncbi:hypothetical protein J6590_049823 [Homalodisca vitripennis]|nr:hypothetical protein J6590_049823 [Homalodisca vitripennis]